MSAAARCCSAWSSAATYYWRISRPGSWTVSASVGGIAPDKPAPRLRLGLGLPPDRARPRQSGDGSDDPGGVGADRGDRFCGRAAGQSRPGRRRFHFRIHLYAATLTALFERERTGRGRLVEVAMQEAAYAMSFEPARLPSTASSTN